jgi:predicted nicotinamide N-methyase
MQQPGNSIRYCLLSAGGFKLWECAMDLARYLCQHFAIRSLSSAAELTVPSRVLELGCGHGIPGILLLLAGSEVFFQVGEPQWLQPSKVQTGTRSYIL